MNRNTELHFGETPQIDIKRSKFEMSHSHKTTFNVGDCIPIFLQEILPGDTAQIDMASLVRMATPIYPIMDNLYLDVYFFNVPIRLLWTHWAQYWGENDSPWIQQTEYEIPQINAPSGGWTEGTIADYMGIPTKKSGFSVNALPFRAYAKIWNDWFRDENLKECCHIYMDETTRNGSNGTTYVTDVELGGKPAKCAKLHDYFTSALPGPSKGPDVQIPLSGQAPVSTVTTPNTTNGLSISGRQPLWLADPTAPFSNNQDKTNKPLLLHTLAYQTSGSATSYKHEAAVNTSGSGSTDGQNAIRGVAPLNLVAELGSAAAASIASLRTAFAIQKYYENAALHGTRYIEYLRGVFGVTSSDARLQRAEYLGGHRIPINIDQIIQTSSTDSTSPQGNTSGFSCTLDSQDVFTKSFEEHSYLMGIAVIRTEHTYQQGLRRLWSRKKWIDWYNPFFAHISEQPVYLKELYLQGNAEDDTAFGYQEAWADYRYNPNYVTGYMRSNATGSLDVWHFADNYTQKPVLGSTWIDEPYTNVDRTIAVTSQLTHQFIADFYYKMYMTRPMPIYSVPGLIDHV